MKEIILTFITCLSFIGLSAQTRKAYNKSVLAYNKHVQTFPGNIFANMYGFTPMEQFKAEENAKEAPKVNFDK